MNNPNVITLYFSAEEKEQILKELGFTIKIEPKEYVASHYHNQTSDEIVQAKCVYDKRGNRVKHAVEDYGWDHYEYREIDRIFYAMCKLSIVEGMKQVMSPFNTLFK